MRAGHCLAFAGPARLMPRRHRIQLPLRIGLRKGSDETGGRWGGKLGGMCRLIPERASRRRPPGRMTSGCRAQKQHCGG